MQKAGSVFIYHGCGKSGTETVIDVDDGNVGRAGVEHGEERSKAVEVGAVADGRGNGDHLGNIVGV